MKKFSDSAYKNLTDEMRSQAPVGESFDILERRLSIGGRDATMFFVDGLVSGSMMQRVMFSLLSLTEEQVDRAESSGEFIKHNLPFLDSLTTGDVEKALTFMYSGLVPLLVAGYDEIIIIDCRDYPLRGVSEPSKEKSLRGSKDGFVESMMTNIALIRRRIRDNDLIFRIYSIGRMTKSDVSMAYMKGRADAAMVEKLHEALKSLDIKGLTVTEQTIVESLTGKKAGRINPFPRVRYTQRPDVTAAHLEEGKIAIIVDNSPTVIMVPAGVFDFVQDVDDYYFPWLTGNYFRFLRMANIVVILFATPVYLLFAEGDIPVHDALRFFITDEEFAISIFWQFVLLEIAIDGLKLASLNTPESLGTSLSIIGALLLGEFSVSSGWFVPQTILCMAVVALASFTQPSIELGYGIKFVRVLMLTGAHFLGWEGMAAAFLFSVCVMAATKTVTGTSYLYPLIPWEGEKLKRLIFRTKK